MCVSHSHTVRSHSEVWGPGSLIPQQAASVNFMFIRLSTPESSDRRENMPNFEVSSIFKSDKERELGKCFAQ